MGLLKGWTTLRVNTGLGISIADGSVPGAELPHTAVGHRAGVKSTAEATGVRDLSASTS